MRVLAKVVAATPVTDRFRGTPGEIVSIENLALDFSSRARKSHYDDLLRKLDASPDPKSQAQ